MTTRFSAHFGETSTLPLDTTFRFNDQISAVASKFVMANPEQMHKQIMTYTQAKKACVQVSYYAASKQVNNTESMANTNANKSSITKSEANKQKEAAAALLLEKKLTHIAVASKAKNKNEGQQKSVLLLARFNFQLPDAKTLAAFVSQYPQLTIKAMTVHSSKGQEAEHVIVLAMAAGEHGFPCHKLRHPFAQILQPSISAHPDAEERRLFYVALTRARQQVYLLCDKDNPSGFIEELLAGDYAITVS